MFSKPLAYPSTLDRRPRVAVDVLRGGALEPEPRALVGKKSKLKHTLICQRFSDAERRGPFSLGRGLNSELVLVQAEHHPFVFDP